MRIAVDAMGGDHAPGEIVAGCVDAVRQFPSVTRLILVGDQDLIRQELDKHGDTPDKIEIRHASEVVEMGESPAMALRRKKDSSIGRAIELVKNGEADAVFSAGNTGAAVAGATLKLRTLKGVDRPAIATVLPTQKHPFVLLDSGANTDCTAQMLCQFAVMGDVYAREILGVPSPKVGLLSIGEEDAKGNDLTKQTFRILQASHLNFTGNVESHDIFEGKVDVAICDGFVGNVVLKTGEAVARAMRKWFRDEFTATLPRKLGAAMLKPAFNAIKAKSDPETSGGAPLLGANGLVFIGHGSSSRHAVFNAIKTIRDSFQHDINHHIIDDVARLVEARKAI
ncbi:MAG: phosphate acyltransferase PlsX [Verrucomicrobia bacterium]|nr:phosphate acyltransferase PlsX [Verrucomicrobiota bacterium]MCH8510194.1 phosphate acyltransferase PlsX [Kiritimatiellia bacterium]